jgi:Domain of unknown function (DUF4157)/A nuclease of the HNH/ENDO VII superfamily with conserved WHH
LARARVKVPGTSASISFTGSDYGGSINLEGDIAGYVVASGGSPTLSAPNIPAGKRLSDALQDYLSPGTVGSAWKDRAKTFLAMNGGVFDASGALTNRTTLIAAFSAKFQVFACNYLASRVNDNHLTSATAKAAASHVIPASEEIAETFINALEDSLKTGSKIEARRFPAAKSAKPGACTLQIAAASGASLFSPGASVDEEEKEPTPVQRQATPGAGAGAVDAGLIPSDGVGYPLDHGTRTFMESRFGTDFSDVRVHTDGRAVQSADALAANAYTTGRDIYFAAGKYAPGSREGQHLLAHELTHTVQQGSGGIATSARISTPDEPLEQQADEAARAVTSSAPLPDVSPSGGVVARDAEKQPYDTSSATQAPTTGIKADAWIAKHAANVIGKVGYELSLAELALTTPFVTWKEGQQRQFLIDFWQPFWASQGNAWAMLTSALAPDLPARAVNSGRDVYPWDIGTQEWREPVVGELYKLFVRRLMESLGRIVPRWRNVRNQLALRLEGGDASADREPGRDEVFASHPIDAHVIGALPGKVDVNFKEYRRAFPEAAAKREIRSGLRPITFDFQMASGAWNWIRVESPVDATPEEVAKTLYGTETKTYLLTSAPPLFGYDEINDLLPVHQKKYNEEGLKSKTDPTEVPLMYDPTPAQQVLAGPLAEEAALLQARRIKPAPTTDPASVLDRMRAIVRTIDRMRFEVTQVGVPGGMASEELKPVRERVDQRSAKLAAATAGEVKEWDAQSRGQLEVVNAAESGVLMAKQQQKTFEAWPSVKNVVSYVSDAYTRAAENSDLYDTGRYWLNIAEDQLRLLPVTLMDFLLAELRRAIQEASPEKMGIETEESHRRRYDIGGMEKREQKLREALVKVRDVVLQHPEQVKAVMEPLFKEISDLQIEVTMVTNMDECDRAWRALYESLSFTGEIRAIWGGGNAIISDALDKALTLNQEWRAIYSDYKSGDEKTKEDAKKRLKKKAISDKWSGYMASIREILQDQAKYDKWMTFALLVGVAIVTGGVGAYVEAAAGAAWGATAGFLTATVAEAATFTTLSYAMVAKDPSVKGFFEDFGKNLLTFGALRIVSRLYRLGVGLETAASLEGKAGEVLTQFALQNGEALYAADQEKRKRTGTGLTASEIGEISLGNMAFLAAVSIGSSLSKSWMTEMQLTGELHGNLINIENTRTKLVSLAEQVKTQQGKDPALAREMLAKQAELLKLEEKSLTRLEELASDPKAAAAAGLTLSQIEKLGKARGEFVDALAQLQQVRVASQLEVVGPNDFLAPRGDFFDGLKKFFTDTLHATVNDNFPADPVTQARTIEVSPKDGAPFRVTERLSTKASAVSKAVEAVPEGEPILIEEIKLSRDQRARLRDVRDELYKFHLDWTDLDLGSESDVARFFSKQPNLDVAVRILERRMRTKIAERSVYGQEQNPATWSSRTAGGTEPLGSQAGPDVPQGQRLPLGTETPDPTYGGFWGGERGNSEWFSDVRAINEATNWQPIRFKNGYPDFRPWARERVFMKVTGDDNIDFAVADRLMAKRRGFDNQTAYETWRSSNRLTWHHIEGASEMILVPRDLHGNVPHVGGASEARKTATAP